MDRLKNDHQVLLHEWSKKEPNLETCGNLLQKLKVALTQITFLPTGAKSATKEELQHARDILEVGAQWSVQKKDIPAFERYMAQLKCYYFDYKTDLPESRLKYELLGLNLLCLLAQNRVAEFHTELELLPAKEIQINKFIEHPVTMEQYMMVGSYNKVFLSRDNAPAHTYNFFMEILLDTVRNEIATCIEKSYEKLLLNEASRMLYFENERDMRDYAKKRGWNISGDYYIYDVENKENSDDAIPASELATQVIDYARELEKIV